MDRRKRIAAKRAAADVLTLEEAAAKLGIGRNQAYDAVNAGKIPALRLGRRWLIPRAAFNRLLNGDPPTTPDAA